MSRIDRRAFLSGSLKAGAAVGAVGLGGGLLDACGGSGASPTTLKKASHAQALKIGVGTGKPKLGGAVAMGTEAEETGMDPTEAHFDSTGICYARAVFDPLAMILEDGTCVPYLAESITPNSTYTKWRITARKNVLFHDGTPCDGKAFQFCMQAFLKSGLTNFAFTNYMDTTAPSKAVTLVDDYTIQMNMEHPWVPFNYWLAGYIGGQIAYMFSPKAFLASESHFNTHPVGTGPFKFNFWDVGSQFATTKNPHYWRKDKYGNQLPYVDSWVYKPLPDVSTRYSALESNTIQMMHTDYGPTILDIASNKKLDAIGDNELSVGEPDIDFAMIDCADPILKDIRLRQALACATDQKELIQVTNHGVGSPTNGLFPKPSPYASDTGYPSYDLAKAKRLVVAWMKDHGGKVPTVNYTTTSTPESIASASVIQQMWEGAGFKINVKTVEQAAEINDALAGGYSIFAWRQFSNVNPDLNYVFWATTSGPINFARNEDKAIQAALDRARQSTDPSVQKDAYETIDKRLAVDLPYIYAQRDVWYVATTKAVQNWNNPSSPTGARGLTMLSGTIWPTEVWLGT